LEICWKHLPSLEQEDSGAPRSQYPVRPRRRAVEKRPQEAKEARWVNAMTGDFQNSNSISASSPSAESLRAKPGKKT
jgi:hypothetical protein